MTYGFSARDVEGLVAQESAQGRRGSAVRSGRKPAYTTFGGHDPVDEHGRRMRLEAGADVGPERAARRRLHGCRPAAAWSPRRSRRTSRPATHGDRRQHRGRHPPRAGVGLPAVVDRRPRCSRAGSCRARGRSRRSAPAAGAGTRDDLEGHCDGHDRQDHARPCAAERCPCAPGVGPQPDRDHDEQDQDLDERRGGERAERGEAGPGARVAAPRPAEGAGQRAADEDVAEGTAERVQRRPAGRPLQGRPRGRARGTPRPRPRRAATESRARRSAARRLSDPRQLRERQRPQRRGTGAGTGPAATRAVRARGRRRPPGRIRGPRPRTTRAWK